jgi:UDP-GlcNAc:undecaprenyl-phosphate GlcNAc-1-phosphate transferase
VPLEARLLVGLTVAVSVVLAATPLAIRVADRLDLYDRPAAHKGHAAPTPYLGGAAVVAGFVLALLLAGDASRTLPLLGGVLVLWALGTADDVRPVGPGWRVAVEAALGLLLWEAGLGWDLGGAAEVDAVITAAWVVAVVNAFNLFDNMDGAATTMAGVAAAALAVLGIAEGDTWLAVAAAALAGACLGFLRHNLLVSPARIFLGDGGSLPIGFAVAALAMAGTAGAAPAWQSLAMGVLLVGVPALDTALVVVSRARRASRCCTAARTT